MTNQVSLTWSEFVEQFKVMPNHLSKDPDQQMYETYGEEVEYVNTIPNDRVWTYLDTDGGSVTTNGFHYVNRIGYFITTLPAEEDTEYEIDLEMWTECCRDCGEAETKSGEVIMETYKCYDQQEYCLNCCGCDEHKGEKWY